MKLAKKSLLNKLIVPFSLLSLASVLTISTTSYVSARESLKQSVFDRLSVASSLKETQITKKMHRQQGSPRLFPIWSKFKTWAVIC